LFWLLLVAFAGGCGGFLLWRYTPVRIRPTTIVKVVTQLAQQQDEPACRHFKMTPSEFAAYFASAHRLLASEEEQFGFGKCYYEAKIEGRVYTIWVYGMAQIDDKSGTEYYAASARALPQAP
jgi:hypothetical protein